MSMIKCVQYPDDKCHCYHWFNDEGVCCYCGDDGPFHQEEEEKD